MKFKHGILLLGAVVTNQFEPHPLVLVVDQNVSVEQADASEGKDEDENPGPDELEDAAMPDHDHLPHALKRFPERNRAEAAEVDSLKVIEAKTHA